MALVANLMFAIGAAPYFGRPNFPQRSGYFPADVRLDLLPFGEQALDHFLTTSYSLNGCPVGVQVWRRPGTGPASSCIKTGMRREAASNLCCAGNRASRRRPLSDLNAGHPHDSFGEEGGVA